METSWGTSSRHQCKTRSQFVEFLWTTQIVKQMYFPLTWLDFSVFFLLWYKGYKYMSDLYWSFCLNQNILWSGILSYWTLFVGHIFYIGLIHIQWNLYLSFQDNSFSPIRRSISMVPERILFQLWLPHLLFSQIHCFFFRRPWKTMNRGFTVVDISYCFTIYVLDIMSFYCQTWKCNAEYNSLLQLAVCFSQINIVFPYTEMIKIF
jgi:hypothetical protein